MNPGDTRDAGARGGGRTGASLNEGRGVNPGDTTPDIPTEHAAKIAALNEGRGVNPGDTCVLTEDELRGYGRSTKAGA